MMANDEERCRSCGAPVVWAYHERTGKPAPLVPDESGRWVVYPAGDAHPWPGRSIYRLAWAGEEERRWSNHFADCPNADDWRAERKR